MKVMFISFLVLFFSFSCTTEDPDKARVRLLETDIAFSRASEETNAAEAFNRFLDDNAIQFPAGAEPIVGREAIVNDLKSLSDSFVLIWKPEKAEVSRSGDMGYTWGRYTVFPRTDPSKSNHGKYVDVWKRQADGSWKVLIDIGNQSTEAQQKTE